MKYTGDDFLKLAAVVEDQGGSLLPEKCTPRKFRIKAPDSAGNLVWSDGLTRGCGNETVFVVPYDLPAGRDGEKQRERGGGFIRACAVDDDMARWPRFAKMLKDTE